MGKQLNKNLAVDRYMTAQRICSQMKPQTFHGTRKKYMIL
jgi:hypothetical protein